MRPAQLRLAAVAGVLAVAIGVATALVVGHDGASPAPPAAIAEETTATTVATGGDHASPTTRPQPRPTPPAGQDARAAKAAAVAFLRGFGMRDPVAATYRSTGPATADVGVHPAAGKGDVRFERATSVVQLHRYADGWVATGARSVDIEVDEPLAFQRIESPLAVSGRSIAFEGTVHVTVLEDRRGPDRVLGRGVVQGGGTEPAPFRGEIPFADHTVGVTSGWVLFSGDTGADLGVVSATAVRVRFVDSDHTPQILGVTTSPGLSAASARFVTLTGSGTLTVRVRAFGADEVRVLLVPTGSNTRSSARLLGVDTTGEDGERWSVAWHYPDQPLTGHLLIQVNGRGGTDEDESIGVEHD